MTAETITFAELLPLIGYSTDTTRGCMEYMSLCQQAEGTPFSSTVGVWFDTPEKAAIPAQRAGLNLWFGVNALRSVAAGRGKADDVIRLAALIADLDLKPGGCPDLETAFAIITAVSEVLGEEPVVVTHSGHGLQPYWAVEVESGRALLAESNGQAKRLGKRFHALLEKIAADHGCGVDSIFDLPRVFRVPGSVNYKDPENPVPVRCFATGGKPLTVEQITTALDAAGIPEEPKTRGSSKKHQPRGEKKKPKDDKPPLYAVSVAMTPGRPSPKVRARLAEALTDVAIETTATTRPAITHWCCCLRSRRRAQEVTFSASARPTSTRTLRPARTPTAAPKEHVGRSRSRHRLMPNALRRTPSGVSAPSLPTSTASPDSAGRTPTRPWWAVCAGLSPWCRRNVQLPAIDGDVASVNLFTLNSGSSGQGKDIANGAARRAVVFKNAADAVVPDPRQQGVGSGEGLARLYKGFGQSGAEAQVSVHLEVNEVGTLADLADRKGYTLVGELLKAFMGQALGFSNAEARHDHLHRRADLSALPRRGRPARERELLLRPREGRAAPALPLDARRQPLRPTPVRRRREERSRAGRDPPGLPRQRAGGGRAPGRCPRRRQERDRGLPLEGGDRRSVEWTRSTVTLMLVRLKVAFGLALLEGRLDINEDDWRIAGQLMEVSDRVRTSARETLRARHQRTIRSRALDQADRELIIGDRLTEDRQKRVYGAIKRKLDKVISAKRWQLEQACTSTLRDEFPAVFDYLVDQELLVVDGGEGDDTLYRWA